MATKIDIVLCNVNVPIHSVELTKVNLELLADHFSEPILVWNTQWRVYHEGICYYANR